VAFSVEAKNADVKAAMSCATRADVEDKCQYVRLAKEVCADEDRVHHSDGAVHLEHEHALFRRVFRQVRSWNVSRNVHGLPRNMFPNGQSNDIPVTGRAGL
jgi:hypothetical protein